MGTVNHGTSEITSANIFRCCQQYSSLALFCRQPHLSMNNHQFYAFNSQRNDQNICIYRNEIENKLTDDFILAGSENTDVINCSIVCVVLTDQQATILMDQELLSYRQSIYRVCSQTGPKRSGPNFSGPKFLRPERFSITPIPAPTLPAPVQKCNHINLNKNCNRFQPFRPQSKMHQYRPQSHTFYNF